jgi:hypothetical protein
VNPPKVAAGGALIAVLFAGLAAEAVHPDRRAQPEHTHRDDRPGEPPIVSTLSQSTGTIVASGSLAPHGTFSGFRWTTS